MVIKVKDLCKYHYPGCFRMCQWYYKDKLPNCYYLRFDEETPGEIKEIKEKAGLV